MIKRAIQIPLLIGVISITSACRLEVIVGDGGLVNSASGHRDCPSASYCINDIEDASFSDSFTAIANPGYEFVRWHDGSGFFCSGSTATTCALELPGGAFAESILSTFLSGQIMPVFKYLGLDSDGDEIDDRSDPDDDNDLVPDEDDLCPRDPDPTCGMGTEITDVVNANGKVWAQPDLFAGITWNQINAVCPEGPCITGGILNGNDMSGWRWADAFEMSVLLEHYNNDFTTGTVTETVLGALDSPWILAFIADGWRSLNQTGYWVRAFAWGTVTEDGLDEDFPHAVAGAENDTGQSALYLAYESQPDESNDHVGGWFYQVE